MNDSSEDKVGRKRERSTVAKEPPRKLGKYEHTTDFIYQPLKLRVKRSNLLKCRYPECQEPVTKTYDDKVANCCTQHQLATKCDNGLCKNWVDDRSKAIKYFKKKIVVCNTCISKFEEWKQACTPKPIEGPVMKARIITKQYKKNRKRRERAKKLKLAELKTTDPSNCKLPTQS